MALNCLCLNGPFGRTYEWKSPAFLAAPRTLESALDLVGEQSYSVTVESPMRIMLGGVELDAVVVVVLVVVEALVVVVEALVVVAALVVVVVVLLVVAAPASDKSTREQPNALINIPLLVEARHWL